uniref:Translocase of inner mitochondrial membrane 44 n=1 Tax=Zosterops lateralis melanops TaxID=1220523 RepID=A0A8D2PYE1_ZOSLA
ENIKQELAKNKEMKESIKKFRDEAKKLEESDALREARRKYVSFGDVLPDHPEPGVVFSLQGVETVKKELDESVLGQTGPYRRPERLRKRTEYSGERIKEQRVFEANEEAMGMVLHKDSKWYQQWKDFKDNNVVFNRFFEMKMKYDESDNAFIRASRAVTDRVTDLLGGLFSKTEMSEVLTEILRVDPSFDKDRFLKQCERDIIPNVLEALISGELDILKDWCYEAVSENPQKIPKNLFFSWKFGLFGKKSVQNPPKIMIFFFLESGKSDKVLRMLYVWALCRDQDELNPYMAWRLLDISSSSTEQVL